VRSLEFPAIQWGLIFGIALSIIGIFTNVPLFSTDLVTAIQNQDTSVLVSWGLLVCAGYILELVVITAAGVLASRETGTIGGGMWAGAIATLSTTIMSFVVSTIILPNTKVGSSLTTNIPGGTLDPGHTAAYVGCQLIGLMIDCGTSALLALPGAWFGRWLYNLGVGEEVEEADDYEEVPYPGMASGAFPAFPPPPGYAPPPGAPPPGYGAPPGYGPPSGPPGYGSPGPPPGYGPPAGPGGYRPRRPPQPPQPRRH
jgi:hypothetical protein